MATKNVFPMAIEIPDVETTAYLRALLYPSSSDAWDEDVDIQGAVFDGLVGGQVGLKALGPMVEQTTKKIWHVLDRALIKAGCNQGGVSAPWLTPKAPSEIGGEEVEYLGKAGIKVGCAPLSLEKIELMVKKCKEGG